MHNIREHLATIDMIPVERKHFSESSGEQYLADLARHHDCVAIKEAIAGRASCLGALAACLQYLETRYNTTFMKHSVRVKFQASMGVMMIDHKSVRKLELVSSEVERSPHCLLGRCVVVD